jgi:hypothetical protein
LIINSHFALKKTIIVVRGSKLVELKGRLVLNRFIFKKSMALLLAVVMLFSSALVNIPVYAEEPWEDPTPIVEGDEVFDSYFGMVIDEQTVAHVMIKEPLHTIKDDWDWYIQRCWFFSKKVWYFDSTVVGATEVVYEIESTMYLVPGDYTVIVVGEFYPDQDGEEHGDVLGEFELVVTTNQPPEAVDELNVDLEFEFHIDEDTTFDEDLIHLFFDPDEGQTIKITGTDSDMDLTHDDTNLRFTPPENWNSVSLIEPDPVLFGTFTVSDERAFNEQEVTATITIIVDPVNDDPVAVDDEVTFTVGDTYEFDVIDNDTDVEGDSLIITSVTIENSDHGSADIVDIELGTDDGIEFTPGVDFVHGTVIIYYDISDGNGGTDTGQLTMYINDVPPGGDLDAADDVVIIETDSGSNVIDVLDNDTIENPDVTLFIFDTALASSGLLEPEYGDVEISGDTILYTPDAGFVGLDFFEYEVEDAIDQRDIAFVMVDVRYESATGQLSTQVLYVNEGDFGQLPLMDAIGEFSESDILHFEIDSAPQYGMAVVDLSGNLAYHANETYDNDRFLWFRRRSLYLRYKVTLTNTDVYYGCVKIYVDSVDKMMLGDDVKTVFENSSSNKIYVLANDYIDEPHFAFNRFLWWGDTNGPLHGSVEKFDDGFKYTPDPGYIGIDSFRYFVIDNDFRSDVADVIISIVPDDIDTLELQDFTLGTNKNTPVSQEVLLQDALTIDIPDYMDIDSLVVTAQYADDSVADSGVITVSGGSVTYNPYTDANEAKIIYTVTDQFGHMGEGVITVTVGVDINKAQVIMTDGSHIRVNQYSDIEVVRAGVEYYPSAAATITSKYERVNFSSSIEPYGYMDDSLMLLGNPPGTLNPYEDPIPIFMTYFVGDFNVWFVMEDSKFAVEEDGFRPISINGQPQISLDNDIDPENITLPDDGYVVPSVVLLETDPLEVLYKQDGFSIFEYLYGFDFEDYDDNLNIEMLLDMPDPELQVKFYLGEEDLVGHDISEFWDVLQVALPGEPGFELDGDRVFTIYDLQFTLTDTEEFESERTEIMTIHVYNNIPVLTLSDDFVAVAMDMDFDPLSLVSVLDIEDSEMLTEQEMIDKIDVEVFLDTVSIGSPEFLNDEGIYVVKYNYTDEHEELATEKVAIVHVIQPPEITMNYSPIDMEPNGLYPVFNGLEVEFFDPADVVILDGSSNGDLEYMFQAFLGDAETGIEIDALVQLPHEEVDPDEDGQYTITYVATTMVRDGDGWEEVTTIETRIIQMVDPIEAEMVYMSDFWKPEQSELPIIIIPRELERRYAVYPIIIKYNHDNDMYRLVSAVEMVYPDELKALDGGAELNLRHQQALDDLAVLSNGDVYALSAHDVFKYNPLEGTLEFLFNLDDEMQFAVNMITNENQWPYVDVPYYNFQSMTADEYDRLVIASGSVPVLNDNEPGHPIFDFEHGLLYFDPEGYDVELDEGSITTSDIPTEEHFLVGLGLVDLGLGGDFEDEFREYDFITDIAYNEDLDGIYGIGGYVEYYGPADVDSKSDERYYQMFNLEEFNHESNPGMLGDYFIKTFEMLNYTDIEWGYRYKGIATIGEDVIITKYIDQSSLLLGDVIPLPVREFRVLYETTVDIYRYVEPIERPSEPVGLEYFGFDPYEGGFERVLIDVEVFDSDVLEGMFQGALGAASTYPKDFVSSVILNNLDIGYSVNPTDKTARFTADVFPDMAYGPIEWSFADGNGGTYFTNNNDGTFTLKESVSTAVNVGIVVSALNKATDEVEEHPYTIYVNVTTAPPAPPAPPVTPTRRTTTTVRVTLDTDAVTLDYGETADPEFTSYDFTETVTGTTNKGVSWELSSDEFVTVDENGVVTAKADVPTDTGDFTVTLTVRTDVGNATDTATILFEEQTPLGAIEFFDPYIAGYPDNSFRPTNYVTRAEVASMFAKILNLNITTSGSQKFMDVQESHWAYGQVQAMYRSGVFAGYMDVDGSRC